MPEVDYLVQIEAPTALYRLFAADGELLYIGIAKNLETRFRTHAREKDWWPLVKRQVIDLYDTRDEAARAERSAINAEKPSRNEVDTIGMAAAEMARHAAQRDAARIRLMEQNERAAPRFARPRDQQRLAAWASRDGRRVTSVVREAVTEYLDKHDPDSKEAGQ